MSDKNKRLKTSEEITSDKENNKEISKENSKQQTNTLLNCPFCGGEAKIRIDDFGKGTRIVYSVECSNEDCFIGQLGVYSDKAEAIQKWNNRKPMQNIVKQLEEEKAYEDSFEDEMSCGAYNAYLNALNIVKEEGGV